MQRQIAAFVEQPSRKTFLAARDAVLRESPLPLIAAQFVELDRMLDQEQYQDVLDRLDALPPAKVLSPRVHFLAAEAADALGHAADRELERCLFVVTLKGLLATGDGTSANPYLICNSSDEHDILEALGCEASQHSIVENAGRMCEVVACSDGREVWFDVTEVLATPKLTRRSCAVRRKPVKPRRSRLAR
jgi:hypothetical protein